MRAAVRDPRGITGLETAIVLIAFVVVASVFAFAALSVGLFSAEESKQTIQDALGDVQGTLGIKGSVFAKHNVVAGRDATGDITHPTGDFIEEITFLVGNAAGGVSVDVTPGKTVIRYSDGLQSILMDSSNEFKAVGLGTANDDQVVQAGELMEITIINMVANLTPALSTGDTFTLEVIPPKGTFLSIERSTPDSLDVYNDLN